MQENTDVFLHRSFGGAADICTVERQLATRRLQFQHQVFPVFLTIHEDCKYGACEHDFRHACTIAYKFTPADYVRRFIIKLDNTDGTPWKEVSFKNQLDSLCAR